MKKIVLFILVFIILVIAISFAVLNAESVNLNFYFGQIESPLSLIIVISLACGALLGVLASLTLIVKLKHELVKLNKTVKLTEKEVDNLRSLPLKDN